MQIEWAPLGAFILATMYTPGPNNISSAGLGLAHGYRRTLPYMLGIALGFFLMMLASALLSATLLTAFPALDAVMRYAGAAYILYLAYAVLKLGYAVDDGKGEPLGFVNGMLLQLVNPKTIVFGFTVFSTFLAGLAGQNAALTLAAAAFAVLAFGACSLWALFGSAISRYLADPRIRLAVNAGLALLLVFSAAELAGIL